MALIVLLTAWLLFSARDLKFDYNFEHFFPVESDEADFYYAHRKRFGGDNDFLMVGLREPAGILNPSTMQKVDSLTQTLKNIPGVRNVLSLSSAEIPVINSFGATQIPILNRSDEGAFRESVDQLQNYPGLRNNLYSADGTALCVFVFHDENPDKPVGERLLRAIEQQVSLAGFSEYRITGKIKSELAYLEKTRFELLLFMSLSAILVVVFLWFTFRNAWGVIVPVLVVLLSIAWTVGIMAVTGKSIDIMIILMPCILFVVGMSDVIHIASQFYEKVDEGHDREAAIKLALKEVGFATFLTCISTAVAFLTLNTTDIQPIRDFGTYTAIGVLVAYLLSITILPWMLVRVKNPDRFKIHTVNERWDRILRRLLIKVYRHPVRIMAGTFILMVLAGWGIQQISINNSVLDDLKPDDPIRQDFRFFDVHFGGVRGFELSVYDPESRILDPENWPILQRVETYLADSMKVGGMAGPLDVLRGLNQAFHEGDPQWHRLPEDEASQRALLNRAKPYLKEKGIRKIVALNGSYARIAGRLKDKGSKAVGIKNDRLLHYIKSIPTGRLQFRITGSSDLIDKSNLYLTRNMLEGLSLDVAVLMLIIGLIFRSWRMMLLSVLPNLVPLVFIAGIMGWFGVEMKVTISIIFSIAFGIAVDDTLHVLSRLKVELDKGYSLPMALRVTFLSTGKAMILTAMVIASGFATLMLSDFKSTFYVGLLISLTLIIALLAELVLMPVLVLSIYGRKYRKKRGKISAAEITEIQRDN